MHNPLLPYLPLTTRTSAAGPSLTSSRAHRPGWAGTRQSGRGHGRPAGKPMALHSCGWHKVGPRAQAARWDNAHPATSQAVCHPPTPFSAMSSMSWPGFMLHPWYWHVGVTNVVCLWSECRTWAGLAACGKLHCCVLPAASSACVALYPKTKHFDLDVMGMKVKANNGSL